MKEYLSVHIFCISLSKVSGLHLICALLKKILDGRSFLVFAIFNEILSIPLTNVLSSESLESDLDELSIEILHQLPPGSPLNLIVGFINGLKS